MVSSPTPAPMKTGISRRTVTSGLAWSVPAIVLAAPAAVAAASTPQIRLNNSGTVSGDYSDVNWINGLGGSERFYDYGVPFNESANFSKDCSQTTDTNDFRYRIRISNPGQVTLHATEANPIYITFRYPVEGAVRTSANGDWVGSQQLFSVLDQAHLLDGAQSSGVTGTATWTLSQTERWDNYPEGGQSTHNYYATLKLTGVDIPAGEWIQISPDWQLKNSYLMYGLNNTKDTAARLPLTYAWLTTIKVFQSGTTGVNDTLVKETYSAYDIFSGAWSFDGGNERPYGFPTGDGNTPGSCQP